MFWRVLARMFMALDWVMKRTVEPMFEGMSKCLDKMLDAENEIREARRKRRSK